ncbi:MAG: hypothetical protein ACLP6G_11185 [Terriglobales bacterium]
MRKPIPKILGAIAILLFGPLLGVLIAFFLAVLSLPPDPNFVSNGGHAAPGDGVLILVYVFISLVASVPLSIWGAVLLFRTGRQDELQGTISAESAN